jgi:glycerol uptake facilitator protein
MSPFVAEIVGTMMLILLGTGVVANVLLKDTKGNDAGLVVITLAWGLAVFIGVVVAGPYSGAHLNPAVSVGLAVAGVFPWEDVPSYIIAQMIGASLGAFFAWVAYKDHYSSTEDSDLILATFSTGPAIRKPLSNVITEAIGTFVLVFVVLYLAGPEITSEKMGEVAVGLGSIGALPVGLLVVVIGMSLGGPTGYAINPARDLAPRIIHALLPIPNKKGSDWGYSWVPVIGPLLGAVVAGLLYLGISG